VDDPDLGEAALRRAAEDLRAGRPVLVVDDQGREDEGDLVVAAELVTARTMAFVVAHTSGFVCVALSGEACDRLHLPPMTAASTEPRDTAYRVTVDARDGVGTGISASDRARTARLLADPATAPAELTRPGHVVPLRARDGGVLARPGHTEAAVDLARFAGLRPAAVLCEVVSPSDPTRMAGRAELAGFAATHGLTTVHVADLVAHGRQQVGVERTATAPLPTPYGVFRAAAYRDHAGTEHLALVMGEIGGRPDSSDRVLVRVHSECLTGEALGSPRCDCGPQLRAALQRIADEGRGVLVYMRGHEGRGIGLSGKLRAYQLQDEGLDTVEANLQLGYAADERTYEAAAAILRELDVHRIELMTNNPAKRDALAAAGLDVRRSPHQLPGGPASIRYLRTKRDRLGHLLTHLDQPVGDAERDAG
jgi:3,4-dihydroxy 2-butanone 4-phosphate synthase/GTP cyclohydrolase II